MEPKIKAPKALYPDKDRLLALAVPKPASTRIWAWCGSAAAVVGGVLALLTPTTDTAKMPPLAHYAPQAIEAKSKVIETPVVERIKPKAPKVLLAKIEPQAIVEVVPEIVPQKTTPAPVQVAHAQPHPTLVEPIAVEPETTIEQEPTLFDRLLEPFRIKRERPKPKQLIASITFTNPFKPHQDEERY